MSQTIPIATARSGRSLFNHMGDMRQDMIGYLEHLAAQGDRLRIPLGLISAYFINRPDDIREVLVTQARKFHKPANVKSVAKALFGENLFTSDGEVWKVLRAAIQPAFHTRRVQAYVETMVQYTQEMVADWQDGQTVNVPPLLMNLTLGITTKALFSQDLRDDEAGRAIVRFIELFNRRINNPLPGWFPTPLHGELRRLIGIGDRLLQPIIDERRASGEDKGDVLSMLLIAQANDQTGTLTDHQVRNEILNLFAAGYEVTAYSLAFTLYLLAEHPAVERRLLAEIDSVLGDRSITKDDVGQMPYLEMVVKESMRLLPATTVLARQAAEPVQLNGWQLRKNDYILVSPWTMHRHPAYYENPQIFDPERFDPDREAKIDKYVYLPFSLGPRICIGNTFALLQMRVNLATILQSYRLSLTPGYQLQPIYQFNTRAKGGLPLILHARH